MALEWAEKNVKDNPQISELIEIRRIENDEKIDGEELCIESSRDSDRNRSLCNLENTENAPLESCPAQVHSGTKSYHGPSVLVGVIKDEEKFDFCMCNPPFFESMEEAGLNPKTACGGTSEEMVCPGGEQMFITHIIKDSVKLKHSFRYYAPLN